MLIAGLAALLYPGPRRSVPLTNAKQVAGLFMQSCLRFAGGKDGLRDWAAKTGLKALPTEAQDQFLYGLPGVVFDASNQGKICPGVRGWRLVFGSRRDRQWAGGDFEFSNRT